MNKRKNTSTIVKSYEHLALERIKVEKLEKKLGLASQKVVDALALQENKFINTNTT